MPLNFGRVCQYQYIFRKTTYLFFLGQNVTRMNGSAGLWSVSVFCNVLHGFLEPTVTYDYFELTALLS